MDLSSQVCRALCLKARSVLICVATTKIPKWVGVQADIGQGCSSPNCYILFIFIVARRIQLHRWLQFEETSGSPGLQRIRQALNAT